MWIWGDFVAGGFKGKYTDMKSFKMLEKWRSRRWQLNNIKHQLKLRSKMVDPSSRDLNHLSSKHLPDVSSDWLADNAQSGNIHSYLLTH